MYASARHKPDTPAHCYVQVLPSVRQELLQVGRAKGPNLGGEPEAVWRVRPWKRMPAQAVRDQIRALYMGRRADFGWPVQEPLGIGDRIAGAGGR